MIFGLWPLRCAGCQAYFIDPPDVGAYTMAMLNKQGCSVGILRPPTTEMSRMISDQVERKRSVGAAEEAGHLDEQIDQMVEMFRMATADLNMKLAVTQYQLHGLDTLRVLSKRRTRNVAQNDILATINPTAGVYAFATGLRGHPLQRAVVAYTDPQQFEDSAQLLGTGVVDMVVQKADEHQYALRRVFALCTSPHEDEAANRFSGNARVVRQAVLYPFIPPAEIARHDGELAVPWDRLGDEECRDLLVENRPQPQVRPSIRRAS